MLIWFCQKRHFFCKFKLKCRGFLYLKVFFFGVFVKNLTPFVCFKMIFLKHASLFCVVFLILCLGVGVVIYVTFGGLGGTLVF